MKKLGKLLINPEKLIKNSELVNLKGGGLYGTGHWLSCKRGSGSCETEVSDCDATRRLRDLCDYGCPGWDSYVCV